MQRVYGSARGEDLPNSSDCNGLQAAGDAPEAKASIRADWAQEACKLLPLPMVALQPHHAVIEGAPVRSQETQPAPNYCHGEQEILFHDDGPEEDATEVDLDEAGVTQRTPDLIGHSDAAGRTFLGH